MNKVRFEAFSDSVFAFAITLLILGIALPAFKHGAPDNAEMRNTLVALWPNVLAYLLSFAAIGTMWHNHQALYRLVERIDRNTVFLNLVVLACIVFIPFATSTLGSYWQLQVTAILYGLVLTCCMIAANVVLEYLIHTRAFYGRVHVGTIGRTRVNYRLGLASYVAATLLAFFSPIASVCVYFIIIVFYVMPRGGADSDV